LVQACRESKISVAEAEERMLRFVEAHTQPGAAILAGNTVHADKGFLQVYMPRFMGHLHYRIMARHHPRSSSMCCVVCVVRVVWYRVCTIVVGTVVGLVERRRTSLEPGLVLPLVVGLRRHPVTRQTPA
jgi:hypothetical protein